MARNLSLSFESLEQYRDFVAEMPRARVEPIFAAAENGSRNRENVGNAVVYNRKALYLSSENYQLVDNAAVLEAIEQLIDQNIELGGVNRLILSPRGMMRLIVATQVAEIAEDGNEFMQGWLLQNSIDGKKRFCVQPMLVRAVCTNGMISAEMLNAVRLLHVTANYDAISEAIASMQPAADEFSILALYYSEFADVELTEAMRGSVDRFLAMHHIAKKRFEAAREGRNVRDVYNAVTQVVSESSYDQGELYAANQLLTQEFYQQA